MRTLQNAQLKQSDERYWMASFLVIAFVFAAPIMNFTLVLTGRANQSGQLALVYIICTGGLFVYVLYYKIHKMSKSTILWCFVPMILLLWFLYTKISYGSVNAYFNSEMRAAIAIWPATILIAVIVRYHDYCKIDERVVVAIDILLTALVIYGVLFSNSKTSGGLQQDESGLIYQSLSYYAAYAIGMTGYIIEEKGSNRKTYMAIMLVQFFLCWAAGGKGGAVLAVVLVLYFLLCQYKLKVLLLGLPIAAFLFLLPRLALVVDKYLNLNMAGFNRVLDFFSNSSIQDTGRMLLWAKAREMFATAPFLGHGLGSTLYEMNSYSHHVFTDLLAETGIVGTIVFLCILAVFAVKVSRNYRTSALCRWLFVIFIAGFTLNIFSGYVWANQMVWIPIVIITSMDSSAGSSLYKPKINEGSGE